MIHVQAEGFADELWKLAKDKPRVKTDLLPHQKRVIDRMKKGKGLVVAHGTGSGKTLSSIAAAVELGEDGAKVLVPAALKKNYEKEIDKHVEGDAPIEVESIQRAVLHNKPIKTPFLVVDEAHNLRNPAAKSHEYVKETEADRRMLLTASPLYNQPEDIAPLVNLAAQSRRLPTGTAFRKKFIQQPDKNLLAVINPWAKTDPVLVKKDELAGVLNAWVDYHKGQEEGFPALKEERIDVPMSKQQQEVHDAAWGRLPVMARLRLRKGLPADKKDLASINQFQSQARQAASSLARFSKEEPEPSLKVEQAAHRLEKDMGKNPRHKAIVYANYLPTLQDYSKVLDQKGIDHALFTGKQSKKQRDQIVRDYNEGKTKALLLSSAGGEGLDLKGTRQVQVLEPHWNEEKLKQVIGRARRYKSHDHLPPKEREVSVQRYAAVPVDFLGKRKGIDQILYDTAAQKERLNKQVIDLLMKDKKRKS